MKRRRVCYRIDPSGGIPSGSTRIEWVDLELHVLEDTTVGEVAQRMLGHLLATPQSETARDPAPRTQWSHTLACDGSALDPALLLQDDGPASGSTVQIILTASAPEPASKAGVAAPVMIHLATGAKKQLRYGHNRMAAGIDIVVRSDVSVRSTGPVVLTADGEIVRGSTGATDGTLIRCGQWAGTLLVTELLRPPNDRGTHQIYAPTRAAVQLSQECKLSAPTPPGRERLPGFPVLSATVPLMMGAVMWLFTGSLWSVGFMGFTFAYVLAAGVESRREAKRERKFRIEEFHREFESFQERTEGVRVGTEWRDNSAHPAAEEIVRWFSPMSERVWERGCSHPNPLEVRLGMSQQPSESKIGRVESGRADLREAANEFIETQDKQVRPLVVNLRAVGDSFGIGIVGATEQTSPLLRSLLFQLAVLCPPDVVAFNAGGPETDLCFLDWILRADDPQHVLQINDRSHPLPANAVPISVSADLEGIPSDTSTIIRLRADGSAWLQVGHDAPVQFEPEGISAAAVEGPLRTLSRFTPQPTSRGGAVRSGDAGIITCADIRLPSSTSEMEKLWSTEPDDLVVPLGLKADGSVISVNLRTDGPHALVAGTTGAGKSELLRTWIASLGARYSPSRVNLLLIDYKGGAAFGELSSLPHCVGLVTDLSAGLADRALVSLRSELKRREVCLSRHRASSLADVPLPERPATLVLVADEFATLASEVPTFLDGVLDIAQRGRSLGIHLILATQRPAGVISDAIRANTSLRIAMRLPDSDDSLDVIDDPSASLLTRDSPGAAIMRFGHEELVLAQIAYSGSVPKSQPSMEVRILGSEETRSRTIPPLVEPEQGAAPKTELETLVANAIAVNANLELPAAHRPWVDALPEQVEYGDVAELSGGDGLAIGVADIVRQQRIDALTVDFSTKGGLAICGGPGSGRSNTLAAVAAAAERRGDYRIHAIDCRAASANGHTSTLRGNRAIDSYMSGLDHEAIHRLLRSTLEPARDRPGKTLLLIDGFAEFCEQQEGINAAVAIDMVSRIAAHSRSNGVDIAITVARRSDLPHQLAHLLGNRLIHRCIEPDEPVNWDAPSLLCDPEIPDGRVWNGSVWAQVMIVAGDPDCALPQAYALPKFLAPSNEPTRRDPPSEDQWELRIGLDLDTLEQTCLDLDRCNALVLGPPRSGRSSTLETIRGAAHNRGIEVFQTDDNPTEMIDTILREAPHAPTLVLLDDLDDWIEDPAVDASLSQLAGFSRRSPLRIVAAGDGTRLQRCFADSMMQLRNARNSVLLGKHAHDLGSVVDTDVRRRDDLTWRQGRAVSVSNGSVAAIQVFFENREL